MAAPAPGPAEGQGGVPVDSDDDEMLLLACQQYETPPKTAPPLEQPNLSSFDPSLHGALVFDEASRFVVDILHEAEGKSEGDSGASSQGTTCEIKGGDFMSCILDWSVQMPLGAVKCPTCDKPFRYIRHGCAKIEVSVGKILGEVRLRDTQPNGYESMLSPDARRVPLPAMGCRKRPRTE